MDDTEVIRSLSGTHAICRLPFVLFAVSTAARADSRRLACMIAEFAAVVMAWWRARPSNGNFCVSAGAMRGEYLRAAPSLRVAASSWVAAVVVAWRHGAWARDGVLFSCVIAGVGAWRGRARAQEDG